MAEGDIVHYEIPAKNPTKLSRFYTNVLGWKFKDMPGTKYFIIKTSAKTQLPSCGMYKKSAKEKGPRTYMHVKNIDAATRRLKSNGGKVLMPKWPVTGMGWAVVAEDIEGNPIGLFQPDKKAGKAKAR